MNLSFKETNVSLEDLFYELTDEDAIKIISKRFPCDLKIEIIAKKLSENPKNAYVDVAFAFIDAPHPRDAFYTHLYLMDILNNKGE